MVLESVGVGRTVIHVDLNDSNGKRPDLVSFERNRQRVFTLNCVQRKGPGDAACMEQPIENGFKVSPVFLIPGAAKEGEAWSAVFFREENEGLEILDDVPPANLAAAAIHRDQFVNGIVVSITESCADGVVVVDSIYQRYWNRRHTQGFADHSLDCFIVGRFYLLRHAQF